MKQVAHLQHVDGPSVPGYAAVVPAKLKWALGLLAATAFVTFGAMTLERAPEPSTQRLASTAEVPPPTAPDETSSSAETPPSRDDAVPPTSAQTPQEALDVLLGERLTELSEQLVAAQDAGDDAAVTRLEATIERLRSRSEEARQALAAANQPR